MCCKNCPADCKDCTGCDGETVGSYEQGCIDFARFGDPEREHYDYEFNACYDRYDGWGDPGCEDSEPRSCGGDCTGCNTGPVFVNLVVPFNYAGSVESDVPF